MQRFRWTKFAALAKNWRYADHLARGAGPKTDANFEKTYPGKTSRRLA